MRQKMNAFVLLIFLTCVLTSCGIGRNNVINDNKSVLSSNSQNSKKSESDSFTNTYNLTKSNYTNQDINISCITVWMIGYLTLNTSSFITISSATKRRLFM